MTRMSHHFDTSDELVEVRRLLITETAKTARLQAELDTAQAKLRKAIDLLQQHHINTSLEQP